MCAWLTQDGCQKAELWSNLEPAKLVLQKHAPGVVKLGPISMGERLRIGGDVDSEVEAEDATPSPLPAAQPHLVKRQYKRKTVDVSEGALSSGISHMSKLASLAPGCSSQDRS